MSPQKEAQEPVGQWQEEAPPAAEGETAVVAVLGANARTLVRPVSHSLTIGCNASKSSVLEGETSLSFVGLLLVGGFY